MTTAPEQDLVVGLGRIEVAPPPRPGEGHSATAMTTTLACGRSAARRTVQHRAHRPRTQQASSTSSSTPTPKTPTTARKVVLSASGCNSPSPADRVDEGRQRHPPPAPARARATSRHRHAATGRKLFAGSRLQSSTSHPAISHEPRQHRQVRIRHQREHGRSRPPASQALITSMRASASSRPTARPTSASQRQPPATRRAPAPR